MPRFPARGDARPNNRRIMGPGRSLRRRSGATASFCCSSARRAAVAGGPAGKRVAGRAGAAALQRGSASGCRPPRAWRTAPCLAGWREELAAPPRRRELRPGPKARQALRRWFACASPFIGKAASRLVEPRSAQSSGSAGASGGCGSLLELLGGWLDAGPDWGCCDGSLHDLRRLWLAH